MDKIRITNPGVPVMFPSRRSGRRRRLWLRILLGLLVVGGLVALGIALSRG